MKFFYRHTLFAFRLVLLLLCVINLAQAQRSGPSAQTIMRRMITTYAALRSYQDSGVVRLVPGDLRNAKTRRLLLQHAAFQPETLVSFETFYWRPKKFRFQWKSSLQAGIRESIVWSDGRHAYRWMPKESGDGFAFIRNTDLGFHMSQSLSSSLGSVFFVPTLLMKEATAFPFADILSLAEQMAVVGKELVEGETCYVIKANLSGVPWVLWVGEKSYLLRKTRTLYSARSFQDPSNKSLIPSVMAEEIHSNIRINRPIPKRVFSYRPVLAPNDLDLTGSKGASQRTSRPTVHQVRCRIQ